MRRDAVYYDYVFVFSSQFPFATTGGRGGVTLVDPDARLGLGLGIDVSHSNPLRNIECIILTSKVQLERGV